MRAPVRPLRGRWPEWLERRLARFFWNDPRQILDPTIDADAFRQSMTALNVGETIKITAANRHPEADSLLLDLLGTGQFRDPTIVDIGASDGSTSLDLIRRLDRFRSYVIADLFLTLDVVRVGKATFFFQADGTCILLVRSRTIVWPTESRLLARVVNRQARQARRQVSKRQSVLLLNPAVQDLIAEDPRVSYRVHDVFEPWTGEPPDIIKVANLLRRLYFDDKRILAALRALLRSLDDGGHLLIVDNPRRKDTPARGGLYRREGARFRSVAQTEGTPEIDDLVRAVSLDSAPN